jgi:hypothetical protein
MVREKMDVALRVLTAFHERTDPIQSDIEQMRDWVDPLDRAAAPDELARMLILAELQTRKEFKNSQENESGAPA